MHAVILQLIGRINNQPGENALDNQLLFTSWIALVGSIIPVYLLAAHEHLGWFHYHSISVLLNSYTYSFKFWSLYNE